ncbi:class I SAM-dependent methyltransferase [Kutzneria kofuensis]|uniref:SAM-dependent methyltransferase n=1 Tax=Kutzneria kofuensis TaxID=103725 RepID=A0A7W9KQC7_9PSEU|nr:class I SAM-dependent methyltransferase [Kutzneria kofuensis]MBB5896789.1 SAM-dependent methyltransferase [Kutzneria kofuensis]
MIARKALPAEFLDFNRKWGAPGRNMAVDGMNPQQRLADPDPKRFGPFGFQFPNEIRTFEYPFAASHVPPGPRRVLDVGAGLSGLQFVLDMQGADVTVVDPAAAISDDEAPTEANFWLVLRHADHAKLNELFGTSVTLVGEGVQHWDHPAESFDTVVCLSVLEHVDPVEAREMLDAITRLLKPGGQLLLTVDLFLDLKPFGVLEQNVWGRSHDVYGLLRGLPLRLDEGERGELLGFPEFDFDRVVKLLPELLVSKHYPVMSQSMVLTKVEPEVSFS